MWYMVDGREIEVVDLVGGYGSVVFGHNHPELAARSRSNCVPIQVNGLSRLSSIQERKRSRRPSNTPKSNIRCWPMRNCKRRIAPLRC
jgi:acetylornithine/succinyldiaminopimelate/putrescine aminotransferase